MPDPSSNAVVTREPLGGPAAWKGADLVRSDSWRRTLSSEAIAEMDAALQHVKACGLDWQDLTKDDFPLEAATAELAEVSDLLENGPGIVKLSGFPVERYSEAECRAAFFALGRHMGTPVFQNGKGQLMNDIADEGSAAPDQYGKVETQSGETFLSSRSRVHSTGQLRLHNDRTDVVALLCMQNAVAGGINRIASAVAIHDALLARRPDLLELLFQDYYRSRFGEEDKGNADSDHAQGAYGGKARPGENRHDGTRCDQSNDAPFLDQEVRPACGQAHRVREEQSSTGSEREACKNSEEVMTQNTVLQRLRLRGGNPLQPVQQPVPDPIGGGWEPGVETSEGSPNSQVHDINGQAERKGEEAQEEGQVDAMPKGKLDGLRAAEDRRDRRLD